MESGRPEEEVVPRIIQFLAERHSGPLPHPKILAQYGEVIPNAPERILAMAEAQSQHRREMEKEAMSQERYKLQIDFRLAIGGLVSAFIITICFLAVAGILISQGHEVSGAVLGVIDLTALVGVFIYGSRLRGQQLERNAKGPDSSK